MHSLVARFQPRQLIIFELHPEENLLEAVDSLAPLPLESGNVAVIQEPHDCKAVRTGRYFVVNDASAEPLCSSEFVLPKEGGYYCGPLIAGASL